MKAAVLVEKERFEIQEVTLPPVGDNQILIKIHACCICNATDMKLFKGVHNASKFPLVIGHECSGIVVETGKNIVDTKIGDRVVCGVFENTQKIDSLWGGYAEYGITTPKDIAPIPDSVSFTHATLGVMLSEAINAVRIADIKPGARVVIVGSGAVGLNLLTVLNNTYAESITVVDISDEKLKLAQELGADYTFHAEDSQIVEKITANGGADYVFEAVGKMETYEMISKIINRNATIVPFGVISGDMTFPFRWFYSKQAKICWCGASGDTPVLNKKIALNMIKKGQVSLKLITNTYKLSDINKAFSKLSEGNEIRVIVEI